MQNNTGTWSTVWYHFVSDESESVSPSVVSNTFVTPWTVACQAPLSMGFSRQEYWSGLLFPPPEDLRDPGIEPESPALAGRFFTTAPPGKPYQWWEVAYSLDALATFMCFKEKEVRDKHYKDSVTRYYGEVFRDPVIWAFWIILSKIKVKCLYFVFYAIKNRPFWV